MLLKIALFRLAFAAAPTLYVLTSQHIVTRRPVLQKVRDNTFTPCGVRSAFSACKHTISGSISLPFRGAFHLSLTVLITIGHLVVFSLGRWSSLFPPNSTCWVVLRILVSYDIGFAYMAFTLFRAVFQTASATYVKCPYTSPLPRTYCYIRFGLLPVRSPLLR